MDLKVFFCEHLFAGNIQLAKISNVLLKYCMIQIIYDFNVCTVCL